MIFYFTSSLLIALCLTALTIKFSDKVQHPTRDFVPQTDHEKSIISPFGGICIFLSSLVIIFCAVKLHTLIILMPIILIFALGALDDYKKVTSNNHEGVSAKKKFAFQLCIGILVCYLNFNINPNFGNFKIIIPFYGLFEFGLPMWLAFIISCSAFVSTINAVNLTDGLDGLTGKQIIITLIFLFIILHIMNFDASYDIQDLKKVIIIFSGGIVAFLFFNSNPSSIFMGDSGSMGIGALIASLFIMLKLELMLPIICFIFFIETLSVVMQVIYFKATKGKRLFRMSPIHHHFQLIGMKEQKITEVAFLITSSIVIIIILSIYVK